MARADRTGKRIPRSAFKKRIPDLGRYFIYTDADETEEKYMYGLRDSLPKEYQGRIVIKVSKTNKSAVSCFSHQSESNCAFKLTKLSLLYWMSTILCNSRAKKATHRP